MRRHHAGLFVLVALLVPGCGGARERPSTTTGGGSTVAATSAPSTTPASPPLDYRQASSPRRAGTGFLQGVSLDGSAAYVEEEHPDFPQPGCEGQPSPVLMRLELSTGRREVLATAALPVRGEVVPGPGDRVVLADGCEGFLSRLVVGTQTADGHLRNLRPVPLAEPEPGLGAGTFSWTRDGSRLLAATLPLKGDPSVVRVEPASGAVTKVFDVAGLGGALVQVAELDGGRYAIAGGGRVEIRSATGERLSLADGIDFAVAPDARSIVVVGATVATLPADGQVPTTLVGPESGREISSVSFSPDGRAVVFVASTEGGADGRVGLMTLADRQPVELVKSGQWGRPRFSGDGRVALLNRFFPAPRFVPDVVAVSFGA